MRSITEIIKALAIWRDRLTLIDVDQKTTSELIRSDVPPDSNDGKDGVAASERHERNLYIYGLPPM